MVAHSSLEAEQLKLAALLKRSSPAAAEVRRTLLWPPLLCHYPPSPPPPPPSPSPSPSPDPCRRGDDIRGVAAELEGEKEGRGPYQSEVPPPSPHPSPLSPSPSPSLCCAVSVQYIFLSHPPLTPPYPHPISVAQSVYSTSPSPSPSLPTPPSPSIHTPPSPSPPLLPSPSLCVVQVPEVMFQPTMAGVDQAWPTPLSTCCRAVLQTSSTDWCRYWPPSPPPLPPYLTPLPPSLPPSLLPSSLPPVLLSLPPSHIDVYTCPDLRLLVVLPQL